MTMYEYMATTIVVFTMFSVAVAGISSIISTSVAYSGSQNEKAYAESLFESVLTTTGTPGDWGADIGNHTYPDFFGLAASYSSPYDLDANKLLKLYAGNPLFVPYKDGAMPTDAIRMLGLRGEREFRLRFLLPLRISATLSFSSTDNIIRTLVVATDVYGRPVPLLKINMTYAVYYDRVNLFTGLNAYKSNEIKVLTVSDAANSSVVYNILALSFNGQADELGRFDFRGNLTSVLISVGVDPAEAANAGNNVAVVVTVGRAALGGVAVPYVAWWNKPNINIFVISGAPACGYLIRGEGQKLTVIYDPEDPAGHVLEDLLTTINEAQKKANPYKVETAALTPTTVSVSVAYDMQFLSKYYIQSYKNGLLKAFNLPLIAQGAPLQSTMGFKTKGNQNNPSQVTFDKIIIFIDPLLMVAPPLGSSTGLEYGASPSEGIPVVKLQRMVTVEGYSYIAEFWLWRR